MSDATYIDQAVGWSKDLTRAQSMGTGDVERAMRNVERIYGIDYWTLWRLRYRRQEIKTIGVSVYMRLREAYQAECERQMRMMRHELERTKAIAGPDAPAVVAASTLVDTED